MSLIRFARAIAISTVLMLAPATSFAQELVCPEGYPIDCGTGSCCPANNYCVPEGGCAPSDWSSCGGGSICPPGTNIYCARLETCYSNYDAASADGCSFEETTVCSVPVQ